MIPRWLVILVGGLVILFGAYRIKLSFRTAQDQEAAQRRGGLYGINRRTHLLVGLVYLIMGGMLLLTAFGIRILPQFGK